MLPADSPFVHLPPPGPHPAAKELRAYAAGSLAPAEEHRIELHTQDCERCADVLNGLAMTDAATTDQAVAALRTRLQARIGTAEPEAVAAGWAWPRIAAAVALLGLVGGGLWTWEQHEPPVAPVIARLETAAPAAAPTAPAAAPAPMPRPAPRAAQVPPTPVATVPKAASRPEYAAVLPSRAQKSSLPARPLPAASAASAASADLLVLADKEAAPASKTMAGRLETLSEAAEPDAKQAAAASAPSPLMAKKKSEITGSTSIEDAASGYAQDRAAPPPAMATAPLGRSPGMRMPATSSIGPAPVGGTTALRSYVRQQVAAFEPDTKAPARTGIVRVRFIVGADGKLSDLKILRSLGPEYDAEALRIVCEGPAWRPGIAGGRRAPLSAEVEVPF